MSSEGTGVLAHQGIQGSTGHARIAMGIRSTGILRILGWWESDRAAGSAKGAGGATGEGVPGYQR